jgi:aspartate/methionine/tyrosine aminotransferase
MGDRIAQVLFGYTFVGMRIEPFGLERLLSIWENRVDWNLSESGVHPLRVEELADTAEALAALLGQSLGYPQTNGTPELRATIAGMYAGVTPEHIEVTNGGSEANCIALWSLVDRADEVVMMTPNYMQMLGLARALGATVRLWPLARDTTGGRERWRPDLDVLSAVVNERTKAIVICNPNNPTGARFGDTELDAICAVASRVGAWIVSDEIYRGAELDGCETPSMWGRYERTLVTSGLSKAYGLPGLRLGWIVGPPSTVAELWGIHDYTTIAPGAISDRLARVALEPRRRERLLARTRTIIRTNYDVLRKWIELRAPALTHVPPDAGAIAFVRYQHAINSTRLMERLRDQHSVLVVPGDHFDMDGYLRIGFGAGPAHFGAGLARIGAVLDGIPLAPATGEARR